MPLTPNLVPCVQLEYCPLHLCSLDCVTHNTPVQGEIVTKHHRFIEYVDEVCTVNSGVFPPGVGEEY